MIKLIKNIWFGLGRFIKRYGLGISVTILVGISIVLSALLWYSVSNPGEMDARQEQQEGAKKIVANKPIQAVYDTDRLILNHNHKMTYVVNYRGLANAVSQQAYTWKVDPVKSKTYSKKAYVEQIASDNHVVLGYPDDVAGEIVNKDFKSDLKFPKNTAINQVVVPLNGEGAILFGDDKHHKIYRAKLKTTERPIKYKKPTNTVDVKLIWRNGKTQSFSTSPIHIEKRSYLLESSKIGDVTQNVFEGTNNSPKVTTQGDKTTYRSGNRQLTLNQKTGGLTLNAYLNQKTPHALSKKDMLSYRWLTARTTIPENMYYFETDNHGRDLNYRLYSDGLPIFNHDVASLVKVAFNQNQQVEVRFSKFSIQVPLPQHENRMVTLPDEGTATKKVESYGVKADEIQDLRVGYEWVNQGNPDFVNLNPQWFVKTNGRWLPVDQRLKAYKDGGVE
ncbi:regulatory protein YycH of two-component signal transduction system YycFG [Weissella uvarum]|uniref:two-component system activity regulator YycH n=1 Tax=Weissella uvarum TaxID=1479233 RepID=UPI00196154AD|nr:two-component system activity regulator YycH [Weissella uvarum]MBM7617649.1 regulatory protein YycH of two-component signal transduction system YycFG [Weissella uvarum]MCM0595998.1 hypothetical protein [Weissella uvarum]